MAGVGPHRARPAARRRCGLLPVLLLLRPAGGLVYFKEEFSDDDWRARWIESDWKVGTGESGESELAAGNITGFPQNKGLRTVPVQDTNFSKHAPTKGKWFTISTRFEPFSSVGMDLVVQYVVKNEMADGSCDGMYLKLFPSTVDQRALSNTQSYAIMFGPDICGLTKHVTHLIVRDGADDEHKAVDTKRTPMAQLDPISHVYQLTIRADRTWQIMLDNEIIEKGDLVAELNLTASGGQYDDIGVLAFEVWQVGKNAHKEPASGSIFDSIMITDDQTEATQYAETSWRPVYNAERKVHGAMLRKQFLEFHRDDDDSDDGGDDDYDDEEDEDDEDEEDKDEV